MPKSDALFVLEVWIARIDEITDHGHVQSLLKHIPLSEHQRVLGYVYLEDKKRSLLSSLLQHAAVRHCRGFQAASYSIGRTSQNKPYLQPAASTLGGLDLHKFWNFNTSHHGDFVALGVDGNRLVGVDLVDVSSRSTLAESANAFIAMFTRHLTPRELSSITSRPSEVHQYNLFYIYWALKESYVKAIGQGLGCNLQEVDFEVSIADGSMSSDCARTGDLRGTATVCIAGVHRHDWRFEFLSLDDRHVIAIALGPPADAVPSYAQCVGWSQRDIADWNAQNGVISRAVSDKNGALSVLSQSPLLSSIKMVFLDDLIAQYFSPGTSSPSSSSS